VVVPGALSVDEETALVAAVHAEGGRGAARLFAEGLPPGARWDEATGKLTFVPDFTQGGLRSTVKLTADDGQSRARATFDIHVVDTIKPPVPVITKSEPMAGYARLTVTQTTDSFLDSPGYAGRTFTAIVIAPTATGAPLPVRVGLHGFDGAPDTAGWSGEFRIFPADPANTYWWGYASALPGGAPTSGDVPEYTARRSCTSLRG
jgi:hypothetical protein